MDLTISKFKSALECEDFECEDTKYADFIKKIEEAETLQLENTSVTWGRAELVALAGF
jgi:hypothetical protein